MLWPSFDRAEVLWDVIGNGCRRSLQWLSLVTQPQMGLRERKDRRSAWQRRLVGACGELVRGEPIARVAERLWRKKPITGSRSVLAAFAVWFTTSRITEVLREASHADLVAEIFGNGIAPEKMAPRHRKWHRAKKNSTASREMAPDFLRWHRAGKNGTKLPPLAPRQKKWHHQSAQSHHPHALGPPPPRHHSSTNVCHPHPAPLRHTGSVQSRSACAKAVGGLERMCHRPATRREIPKSYFHIALGRRPPIFTHFGGNSRIVMHVWGGRLCGLARSSPRTRGSCSAHGPHVCSMKRLYS